MADVHCNVESCDHNIDGLCFADEIDLVGCSAEDDNVVSCKQFVE